MTTISFPSKYVPEQLTNDDTKKQLKMLLNPYSVLRTPGVIPAFLKITYYSIINQLSACKIKCILLFSYK